MSFKALPILDQKGRGSQINPTSRFESIERSPWVEEKVLTSTLVVHPKTIINKVDSEDIPFRYSANPYQGCEHGCIYCYARPSHNFWGYSSGLDFESKILVKANAPKLLKTHLEKKSWKGEPIMFSGNTDCYQPIERTHKLTREMLKICVEYNQSVGLITKNKLLLRDLDLLEALNNQKLVSVAVSLNTLDDNFRHKLEPRASSVKTRLELIESLVNAQIPVHVLMAPIIPGLNDHEIFSLVEQLAKLGVPSVSYIVVRLNYDLETIFSRWLDEHFADRKEKVLNGIRRYHEGALSNYSLKTRMKGTGEEAKVLRQSFKLALRTHDMHQTRPVLNTKAFKRPLKNGDQLSLF